MRYTALSTSFTAMLRLTQSSRPWDGKMVSAFGPSDNNGWRWWFIGVDEIAQ